MSNTRHIQDDEVDKPFGYVLLGEKKAFFTTLALLNCESHTYQIIYMDTFVEMSVSKLKTTKDLCSAHL